MHSSWRADLPHEDVAELVGGAQSGESLRHITERSTSAPPLPVGRHHGSSMPFAGVGGTFLLREDLERGSVPAVTNGAAPPHQDPGFKVQNTDEVACTLRSDRELPVNSYVRYVEGSENTSSLFDACVSFGNPPTLHSRPSQSLENSKELLLKRSQSAAPELLAQERSATRRHLGAIDRPDSDFATVFPLGYRRPASTGVIGQHNASSSSRSSSLGMSRDTQVGGAVRPAPKTLMDLIQEDFPKSPPPLDHPQLSSRSSNLLLPNQRHDLSEGFGKPVQSARQHPVYLPTCAVSQGFGRDEASHEHAIRSLQSMNGPQLLAEKAHIMPTSDSRVSEKLFPISQQRTQSFVESSQQLHTAATHRDRGGFSHARASVDEDTLGPNTNPSLQENLRYANSSLFRDNQETDNRGTADGHGAVSTRLLPSGHAVYLNPPPFGYALQYHAAAPQNPHLPSQTIASSNHRQHDYVSIVPIQGGTGGQVPSVSSAYTFWPPHEIGSTNSATSSDATPDNSACWRQDRNFRDKHNHGTRSYADKANRRGGHSQKKGAIESIPAKHSMATSLSSSILDEFHAKKKQEWTVGDIRGHVVEFCQDQNGSRLIQQRLEVGDTEEQLIVMSEVLPAVCLLRNDVFGNYVVQKLFEHGTADMKAALRDTLGGEMLPLSLQMYGCRVVQKALETLDEDDLPGLLVEFHHNVISCIHDQNGNHVIQKCIEVISSRARKAQSIGDEVKANFLLKQIDFVVDDVLCNVSTLSCHPYGCRVLQRILEHCHGPKKTRALDEIRRCQETLLDDQYGNYVIQHVLKFGRHADRESVLSIVVKSGLLKLSRQKYASNVVEKLLHFGTPTQRNVIVREMLKVVDGDTQSGDDTMERTTVVLLMVRDAYANYVVQTTLDVVGEGAEKRMLIEELKAHATQLRNYAFAKHIATKLNR